MLPEHAKGPVRQYLIMHSPLHFLNNTLSIVWEVYSVIYVSKFMFSHFFLFPPISYAQEHDLFFQ